MNRDYERSGDYESTTDQVYLRHISQAIEEQTAVLERIATVLERLTAVQTITPTVTTAGQDVTTMVCRCDVVCFDDAADEFVHEPKCPLHYVQEPQLAAAALDAAQPRREGGA